jgi:hypothetical protein
MKHWLGWLKVGELPRQTEEMRCPCGASFTDPEEFCEHKREVCDWWIGNGSILRTAADRELGRTRQ